MPPFFGGPWWIFPGAIFIQATALPATAMASSFSSKFRFQSSQPPSTAGGASFVGGHFGRTQRGVSKWRSGLKARGGEKPEMSEIQSWSGLTPGKEFLGLMCHILTLFLP